MATSIDASLTGGSRSAFGLDSPVTRRADDVETSAARTEEQGDRNEHHRPAAGVVADHVAAVNAFDIDAIVATFVDDALVNDNHREFWGAERIRAWVAAEIVGDHVTIAVMRRSSITA